MSEDELLESNTVTSEGAVAGQTVAGLGDLALDSQRATVVEIPEIAQKIAQGGLAEGDAASFVEDIDKGVFPTSQALESRLRTRTTTIFGEPTRIALTENNEPADKDGGKAFDSRAFVIENRQVEPEQVQLLREVAAERLETERISKQAERDIKSIADMASFYRDVLSGEISGPLVLESRLRTRTTTIFGEPTRIALTADNEPADKDGDRAFDTRAFVKENRQVEPEQEDVLKVVVAERQETRTIAARAKQEIGYARDTGSFCGDILSGNISTSQALESRLRTRTTTIFGEPTRIALTADNEPADKDGGKALDTRVLVKENRQVSLQQSELLRSLQQEILDARGVLPREVNDALTGELSTQLVIAQIDATKAKKDSSQVMAEIEVCEKTIETLGVLQSAVDRAELLVRFGTALADTANAPSDVEKVLVENDNNDQKEIQLVGVLRRQLDKKVIGDIANYMLLPGATPAEIFKKINEGRANLVQDTSRARIDRLSSITSRLELLDGYFGVFEGARLDTLNYQDRLRTLTDLPIKASTNGFDAFAERTKLVEQGKAVLVTARAAEIRQTFADKAVGAGAIIDSIMELPLDEQEDMPLQEELLGAFALYIAARRRERPDDFRELFIEESLRVQKAKEPEFLESLELGRNLEGFQYLTKGFKEVIQPLFQALRADERTEGVKKYLSTTRSSGTLIGRESFVIKTSNLRKQRELTEIEDEYLRSIELLSAFSPHLVAIACEAPDVARIYLQNHFSELSRTTGEGLQDGDYVPLLLFGAGPAAITALGELVRVLPGIAGQTLVVDNGDIPGGPFAIPGGPAWDLNSANERGAEEPTLPDSPQAIAQRTGVPEEQTVRAYGSPLPWYPGERSSTGVVRKGSINTTVDYLPTPDDLSEARYPTNDDLALLLQLQMAMLAQKMCLQTEVMSITPAPDDGLPGDKLVTLALNMTGQKQREITVRTDAVINGTGLGQKTYGFKLEGSKAEQILAREHELPANRFPILTDTLGAFRALADKEGETKILGETLVVSGKGNSTDTILEYVGQLFDGENVSVRNVKKIVVIADGDQSKRPRYLRINDLRPRNGRENLVSVVTARVGDIEMVGDKVRLLDESGNPIVDASGQPIIADSVIAATGFAPTVDRVFKAYLEEGQSIRNGDQIEKLTLPTNPGVAVADTLSTDPSVMFIGTSSRPEFKSPEKLAQLPPDAREALLRNGAENAVAIGFRTPDTRAATRLFIDSQRDKLTPATQEPAKARVTEIDVSGDVRPGSALQLGPEEAAQELPLRRGADADSAILTPLLLYELGKMKARDSATIGTQASLDFVVSKSPNGDVVLTYDGPSDEAAPETGTSTELVAHVATAIQNPRLQAYAFRARNTRRQRNGFRIRLGFSRGVLDLKTTFMEPL